MSSNPPINEIVWRIFVLQPLKWVKSKYQIPLNYKLVFECTLIFLIWPILDARSENFICCLGDLKTAKFPSKIVWPLCSLYMVLDVNCQAMYNKNCLGQKIIDAKRNFNYEVSSKVENNTIRLKVYQKHLKS